MKRWVLWGIGGVLAALSGLAAVMSLHLVGGEAVGTISKSGQGEVAPVTQLQLDQRYDGKYVSFTYPGSYRLGNGITDERLELVGTGKSKQLVMTIGKGALENDPSYNLRLSDPKAYKQLALSVDGLTGTVFTSTASGFEKTAYIRGARWASVAISDVNSNDWSGDLDQVLATFHWK